MDLTDVARRVVVTACIIPRPAEHPQHVHTVLVAVPVVRFVVIPRGVRQWLLVGDPVPVALRILIRSSGPEVAMANVYSVKKKYYSQLLSS